MCDACTSCDMERRDVVKDHASGPGRTRGAADRQLVPSLDQCWHQLPEHLIPADAVIERGLLL